MEELYDVISCRRVALYDILRGADASTQRSFCEGRDGMVKYLCTAARPASIPHVQGAGVGLYMITKKARQPV